MKNSTAVCGLNMTAADLEQIAPMLSTLCFDRHMRSLAVIGTDRKTFEQVLLERIGRFVEDGSYIEMTDENGKPFRWVFTDKQIRKVRPVLVWPETDEEEKGGFSHG